MTTLIIGAGMAGLSAGYYLRQAGETVTVLEARDRIGGRVHTNRTLADFPVELGAELIHGSDVITWNWVRELGLDTVHWRKHEDALVTLQDGTQHTMLEARQRNKAFDRARAWADHYPPIQDGDEDFESYLKRVGYDEESLHYVRRTFANSAGDDMHRLSARSMMDELAGYDRPQFSDPHKDYRTDYRILNGYDSVLNHLAEGLEIILNTPIAKIDWQDGVKVTASDGRTFHADRAIIAVSLGVLKANHIQFSPPLPASKQQGIDAIDMGPVMKMVYVFDRPITPTHISSIFSAGTPPMWWTPNFGRENTQKTVWTAFFSGDYARELLALGEADALQRGLETLRKEVNQPDIVPIHAQWVNWVDEPYTLGGYSVVRAGSFDARDALAMPTAPLYWAGEATAPHADTATVHGAILSGLRAAKDSLHQD